MGFKKHHIPIAFVAHSGWEAVELFKDAAIKPNVIIMDYWMPYIDGIEAAKCIHEISPDVKIIFLSGERVNEKDALKAGAIRLIKKPSSLSALIKAVCEAS